MMQFARTISSIEGYRLWDFQRQILFLVFVLCIPTMYINIWNKHQKGVLLRYVVSHLLYISSTCSTRREGKSTIFQMIAAALVLCAPRRSDYPFGIGIFSINLAASKKMINDIGKILLSMKRPVGVTIHIYSTLIIVKFPDGKENRIYGFQTGEVSFVKMWVSDNEPTNLNKGKFLSFFPCLKWRITILTSSSMNSIRNWITNTCKWK